MLPIAEQLMPDPRVAWLPVVLMLIIAVGFAIGNLFLTTLIGPSRTGRGKETTYESGMMPVGDTHKRFNVRFYLVAMIFLVIDVEIVFMYPFATIFTPYLKSDPETASAMFIGVLIFTALLLDSYIYAWGKGVFKWD